VLEVCPTSNIRTAVYPDYAAHPLNRLRESCCAVTLNSDDPPYFATSIGQEYDVAKHHFGWSDSDLASATATSLDAAFIDPETRTRLRTRLRSACTPAAAPPNGAHAQGSAR